MNSWISYEYSRAQHQDRLRQAEHSRLVHAMLATQQDSPAPLLRLTGTALTAAGGWLISMGKRLQTDPPAVAWEDQCC